MADQDGLSSRTTTDHEEIRAWVESRGGRPAVVADTEDSSGSGVLRIEFDSGEDRLAESDWDTFFRTFDDRELAFLYQDKTADGETSRFNKLIRR
jgi:hypothetical protein